MNKLRSKLIKWLVGKTPIAMNVAIGIPDRSTAEWSTRETILAKHGTGTKYPMLLSNVLIYKSAADPKDVRSLEIDYHVNSGGIAIDPEELA